MVEDEGDINGPQELLVVSRIQNAINNRVRWLYHNPTAIVGHTIHNVDISHLNTYDDLQAGQDPD